MAGCYKLSRIPSPTKFNQENSPMLKVTPLAIALLTIISIAPQSQAMTATVQPLSLQQPLAHLQAQHAPPPSPRRQESFDRELLRRTLFPGESPPQKSPPQKSPPQPSFDREPPARRSSPRELHPRQIDRRRH